MGWIFLLALFSQVMPVSASEALPGNQRSLLAHCAQFFGRILPGNRRPLLPSVNDISAFQGSHFFLHRSSLPRGFSVKEASEAGFRRVLQEGEEEFIKFERDGALLAAGDRRLTRPDYVSLQAQRLRQSVSTDPSTYGPSRRERLNWVFPEPDGLLTANTISSLREGRHAFVLLEGENFLRIGVGHPRTGGGWAAVAAGEVELRRNSRTQRMEVVALNNRSDTYRPDESAMVPAVEALWRQGLYPRTLRILQWDHQAPILDLSVP
jgi:hypothetical protein